jgi:hypothetical protein
MPNNWLPEAELILEIVSDDPEEAQEEIWKELLESYIIISEEFPNVWIQDRRDEKPN